MRKKHQPGCPCCTSVETPPIDCTCNTTLQVNLYNLQDEATASYLEGFAVGEIGEPLEYVCCPITHTGFSDAEGTYYIDVAGTPDFTDLDGNGWFLITKKLSNESPMLINNEDCPDLYTVPYHECLYFYAYLKVYAVERVGEDDDACVVEVVFRFIRYDPETFPPVEPIICDESGNVTGFWQNLPILAIDRCQGATGYGHTIPLYTTTVQDRCDQTWWSGQYDVIPTV